MVLRILRKLIEIKLKAAFFGRLLICLEKLSFRFLVMEVLEFDDFDVHAEIIAIKRVLHDDRQGKLAGF